MTELESDVSLVRQYLDFLPGKNSLKAFERIVTALSEPKLPPKYRVRRDTAGDLIVFFGRNVAFSVMSEDREIHDLLSAFLPKPEKPASDVDTEAQRQSWLRGEVAMGESVAKKPAERESLVEALKRERIGGDIDYWAKNTFDSRSHDQEARETILWLLRKLDERAS